MPALNRTALGLAGRLPGVLFDLNLTQSELGLKPQMEGALLAQKECDCNDGSADDPGRKIIAETHLQGNTNDSTDYETNDGVDEDYETRAGIQAIRELPDDPWGIGNGSAAIWVAVLLNAKKIADVVAHWSRL